MECQKKLDENSILVNGKYQVSMLWSPENIRLPNNYNMGLRRFNVKVAKGYQTTLEIQRSYDRLPK